MESVEFLERSCDATSRKRFRSYACLKFKISKISFFATKKVEPHVVMEYRLRRYQMKNVKMNPFKKRS